MFYNPDVTLGFGSLLANRAASICRYLTRSVHRFQSCTVIARQRRDLLKLDDHALKDIGISRVDACREAGRGFWDIDGIDQPGIDQS